MTENTHLIQEIQTLKIENESLKCALQSAHTEIENLQELLNLNSKNSSKPPSTDQKKNETSVGKKRGPPFGHRVHYRTLYALNLQASKNITICN